jgi:hypothetical protein
MGARSLTSKQRRFAELLAGGCTKVHAFRQAYPSDRRGKGTEWEGAKRVARHPAVVAEVQRLTLLKSPFDSAAQTEHIAARLIEMSKSAEASVALKAIAAWTKLAEAGLLKPPPVAGHRAEVAAQGVDKAQILDELRKLYREGLAAKGQQRNELVTSINTGSIQGADGQSEHNAASFNEPPPSSMMEEPLQSLTECPTDQDAIDEPIPPEVAIDAVPESLKLGDYDRVAIPGHFPVRFRRVPRPE